MKTLLVFGILIGCVIIGLYFMFYNTEIITNPNDSPGLKAVCDNMQNKLNIEQYKECHIISDQDNNIQVKFTEVIYKVQ